MVRDLSYFIILQFYFLPIIVLICLIISWLIKKELKKLNRHLVYLISSSPVILFFFISQLFGIYVPYTLFFILTLEVFVLQEFLYEIKSISRVQLMIFLVIVVLLYIFFFPKRSSYTQPDIPVDLVNPGEPININNSFFTTCSCFGYDLSGSGLGTNRTYCLGIPHSCRVGKAYLLF